MSFISTRVLPPSICSYDATFILKMLHYKQKYSRGKAASAVIRMSTMEFFAKLFEVNMSNRADYLDVICVTTEGGDEKQ